MGEGVVQGISALHEPVGASLVGAQCGAIGNNQATGDNRATTRVAPTLGVGNVPINKTTPNRVWTVAEAKTRSSEVPRLAEKEGPRVIGTRRPFVVVPTAVWEEKSRLRKPLGQWLIENVPRDTNLELPDRSSYRPIPFVDKTGE